jgi:nitrile hydratase accessory protein
LKQPDPAGLARQLADLPRIPQDADGPVFAEPWQAQAFALAVRLAADGHFTWKEWAAALAEELRRDAQCSVPDERSRYYECWLTALERVVIEKGLSSPAGLLTWKQAWADAYRRTPHGKPVAIGAISDIGSRVA